MYGNPRSEFAGFEHAALSQKQIQMEHQKNFSKTFAGFSQIAPKDIKRLNRHDIVKLEGDMRDNGKHALFINISVLSVLVIYSIQVLFTLTPLRKGSCEARDIWNIQKKAFHSLHSLS